MNLTKHTGSNDVSSGDADSPEYNKLLIEKCHIVAEYAHDMVRWVLPDRTLAYISPSSEKVTGYSPREFLEDPDLLIKIIHPDDTGWLQELSENAFIEEEVREITRFRIIRKDGQLRWVETTTVKVFDSGGNFAGYRTSTRDITENVDIENELKISEQRYRNLLDSQTELIILYLIDSTVTYANDAFLKFYNFLPEEFIEKKWLDRVSAERTSQFRHWLEKITPEMPVLKDELVRKRHDGKERWLSWIHTAFFNELGELTELMAVGRDVTEMKDAEIKLRNALEELKNFKAKLEMENLCLRETNKAQKTFVGIVSESCCMQDVLEKVKQVAKTDSPVLIYGETGTGKEMIARAIHQTSSRRNRVMITINCAALPASLIESELFGREKGAYTGALARQIGRFELANNSTLFLDEIGELPPEIQVKLLRVLQFGEFQMLGSPETKKVNVRIIAATNKNLVKAVSDGTFRSDLFYRLNVFPVSLPPLRERKEDIPSLVWSFVDEISGKMGRHIDKISQKSITRLTEYSWPGNIRELRNIVEYSIIVCNSPVLDLHFPKMTEDNEIHSDNFEDHQRFHIEKILNQCNWRVRGEGGAAEKLGMKESTLRYRMKKLGITMKKRN